jgi:hypothetical protein
VRAAEASDDGEAEALVAPDESDRFGGAVDHLMKRNVSFFQVHTVIHSYGLF